MNQIEKLSISAERMREVAESILSEAAKRGASQAEVVISADKGFSVSVRDGDVETVEYNQDKSIDVKVYFGQCSGAASLSDLRPEAVSAAVDAACHIAKFTDKDPAGGLAEKEELGFNYKQLQLSFPWDLSVEQAISLACECEREALSRDKRIMSAEDVAVATGESCYVYANSHGFIGDFKHTRHELSCVLVGKAGSEMQRDYSYTIATDPAELVSPSLIAKEAVEKTVNRLGARRLKTMKTPVIFAAQEARGLLGHFLAAISGGSLYRKSSFLLDHLGRQVFPDFIRIQEHPHLERALGSAAFDGDGVATRENVFVDQGILNQYILGVYSARKLGMKTTGNAGGAHNVSITHSQHDLPGLLKMMGTGLLVTEIMGNGVNLVTGDYSRGVGGYWVERGEIQYPVHEITVAGKLQDMYARIRAVGNDIDVRGNVRTGSILIEEMMVAGE